MNKQVLVKDLGPILAYPFQITDLRQVKSRSGPGRRGRKRSFPGVKIRMMDIYVRELRACAEAIGWRFDAFLYHALLRVKRETERLFGMSNGDLATLSKSDRAKLASDYQAVCEAGQKAASPAHFECNRCSFQMADGASYLPECRTRSASCAQPGMIGSTFLPWATAGASRIAGGSRRRHGPCP